MYNRPSKTTKQWYMSRQHLCSFILVSWLYTEHTTQTLSSTSTLRLIFSCGQSFDGCCECRPLWLCDSDSLEQVAGDGLWNAQQSPENETGPLPAELAEGFPRVAEAPPPPLFCQSSYIKQLAITAMPYYLCDVFWFILAYMTSLVIFKIKTAQGPNFQLGL